ncbi:hypothetical protein F4861DRAFT_529159 [Xylaria intraflava]|nr:hypothetical protein F4861DRAFT_529159 [Xylaria intraflava]
MELPMLGHLEAMNADAAQDSTDQGNNLVPFCRLETPVAPSLARTLLPGPIANAVSFATRSTSLALRIGTAIGGLGLGAAQVTTLSSLELGRSILHRILNRASRDVFTGSPSDLSHLDAESILASSLESMHLSMSRLVFWTAACFHTADVAASTTSHISQLFLSVLDQFFGSTDSSRAVASIITLIRREFQNPATGVQGEKVSVMDLVLGLCGLAYLQNRCRKMIQDQERRLGYGEIIWDVIVLDDKMHGDAFHDSMGNLDVVPSLVPCAPKSITRGFEQHSLKRDSMVHIDDHAEHLFEAQLTRQMEKSLPKDASISISTSTTTIKRITVDITGKTGISIPSLPGLDLVESEVCDSYQASQGRQDQTTKYRVVYTVSRNRVRSIPEISRQEAWPLAKELDSNDDEQPISPISLDTQKSKDTTPRTLKLKRSATAPCSRGHNNIQSQGPARRAASIPNNATKSGMRSPKERPSKDSVENTNAANQKIARRLLDDSRKSTKTAPDSAKPQDNKAYKGPDTDPIRKRPSFRGTVPKKRTPLSRESSSDDIIPTNPKSVSPSDKPSQRRSSKVLASPRISDRRGGTRPLSVSPVRDNMQNSTDTISILSSESPIPSPSSDENETNTSPMAINQEQAYNTISSVSTSSETHLQSTPRESNGYFPSTYTLETRNCQASLVVSSVYPRSVYSDSANLDSLRQSGGVRGMFPDFHFLRNLTRYSRYSSAVYGHRFLRLMGISKDRPTPEIADKVHFDVRSFAHHTKLPCDSILLASFVDPQGGSDASGATDTGIPLVHTVALDKESKAVVFTCRGTLGFADVLADMMCDYDDLVWRGKTYNVHKGIHASARRLLYGGDGRLLSTIKAALEEYPEYGLVLCGHSLGASVAALLGVMLTEPSITGAGFVTSNAEHRKFLGNGDIPETPASICLPPGRPIHVYAYGPLATMSPSLQKATRGLITSTVHGNDVVPYLSLGVLHDFQALALAFKTDNHEAKAEIKRRVWEGLRSGLAEKWYSNPTKSSSEDDEQWAFIALKTLGASMVSPKLLPPGEVFKVESTKVVRKDASARETIEDLARPASRIVLTYIRDVEAHFRQVRFGASMLMDHSPGLYEDALGRLTSGVAAL